MKVPDVIIMKEGTDAGKVLNGGRIRGKVDAIVDLKTGRRGISGSWQDDVVRRLGMNADDIHRVSRGTNLLGAFRIAGGQRSRLARRLLKKGAVKTAGTALVVAGVVLAYQDARDRQWSESEAKAYALASVVGVDLAIDAMEFSGDEFWSLAGSIATDSPAGRHIEALERALDLSESGGDWTSRDQDRWESLQRMYDKGRTPTAGDSRLLID